MSFFRPVNRPKLYVPRPRPRAHSSVLYILLILLASVLLLLFTARGRAATVDRIISSKYTSASEVAITCKNHGDPSGWKVGDTLIISCGK